MTRVNILYCGECHSDLIIDVQIIRGRKKEYDYYEVKWRCPGCGYTTRDFICEDLKEENCDWDSDC